MNELMLREMLSQPDVLESSLRTMRAAVQALAHPSFRRIVLTGSGDSLYAAMAAEHAYQRLLSASVWALRPWHWRIIPSFR